MVSCRDQNRSAESVNLSGVVDSTLILVSGLNYRIEFPGLVIQKGGRLIIESGVKIDFQKEGTQRFGLVVQGSIEAVGTQKNPIVFRPEGSNPQPFDWIGLTIDDPDGPCRLEYCEFSYAIDGIRVIDAGASSPVEIVRCTITRSEFDAIRGRGIHGDASIDLRIEDCSVLDNRVGISLEDCVASVSGNLIEGSTERGIEVFGSLVEVIGNRVSGVRGDTLTTYGIYSSFSTTRVFSNTVLNTNKLVYLVGVNSEDVKFNNIIVSNLTGSDSGLRYSGAGVSDTLDATQNYWGTNDLSLIELRLEGNPDRIRFQPIAQDSLIH